MYIVDTRVLFSGTRYAGVSIYAAPLLARKTT